MLNVSKFNEDELIQIDEKLKQQSVNEESKVILKNLSEIINNSAAAFKELIKIPFNLNLIAGLIQNKILPEEIIKIDTQIKLLEKYWQVRIISNDDQGLARESLIKRIIQVMLSNRLLQINPTEMVNSSDSNIIMKEVFRKFVLLMKSG